MNAASTVLTPSPAARPRPAWERIGNFLVLFAYSCTVLFTVRYHEKWADEAQAWLIARDEPLSRIWFYEARYEGHPGLWHTILWIAQHWFHASYAALGYIGVAFAIAGVAVLIFKAPFPWYVRWPLAFTYFMVYQYAVIARPYTIFPLLCFWAAIYLKDLQHPARITIVLILLAILSVHGTIVAVCLGLAYLLDATRVWKELDSRMRDRYFMCAGAFILTLIFLFVILKPTPDVAQFAPKEQVRNLAPGFHDPSRPTKLLSLVCGAFLDYPIPSFIFMVLAGAWFFTRRRLLIFVVPVALLMVLYAMIQGYAHHHGTVFVAFITAVWIAWPTTSEAQNFDLRSRMLLQGMAALVICLCAVNIWDAALVIRHEYLYPYSGADDAANYLRAAGVDDHVIFGYLFGIVAVEAHFDHNIFQNMPTAYYHHATTFKGGKFDWQQLQALKPDYVVAYTTMPQLALDQEGPMWASFGYKFDHFSDGYYLYKRLVFQRESYLIYRRVAPSPLAPAVPAPTNP